MADRSMVWNADLLDPLEYDPYPFAPRLDISGVSPSAIDQRKKRIMAR